jgi:hypothetical protein
MIAEEELQNSIDQANDLWAKLERGPENGTWWGFYAYGDAPPAIGGGFGGFVWFPERDEMLEFIRLALPYSPPGRSDLDWGKVARETSEIVDQMKNGDLTDVTATTLLNGVLQTFSQFEWMGTFNNLLEGQHRYAIEVRKEFRSQLESSVKPSSQIEEGEFSEFKEFIEVWGC